MHKSSYFRYDREIWGPTPAQSKYDTRADLGNTPALDGDGKKYLGRTDVITYVSPIVALLGLVLSIWWRIDSKIGAAKTEASAVAAAATALASFTRRELADHKLHVAEAYITKAGMRDVKDEILGAGVGHQGRPRPAQ